MKFLPEIKLPPPDPAFQSPEYIRALEFLASTYPVSVMKLGLERISHLLEILGRPQDKFPSVIVAGTNGKGSTSVFLESILVQSGLKVGANLSPHLEQPTERIRVNARDISPVDFSDIVFTLADVIDEAWAEPTLPGQLQRPTFHELMTAAALLHFERQKVDIAILEVGLGGRYDAANAVDAPLVVLTPMGLDHTDRLGKDIASITGEKAAVIRPGAVVVCAPQVSEAMSVISETALKINAVLLMQPFPPYGVYFRDGRFYAGLHIENSQPREYMLGLGGACQAGNADLAIRAAIALRDNNIPPGIDFDISGHAIETGLAAALLPGRFEIVSDNPMISLDGAHNPPGAKCLARTLDIISGDGWWVIWGQKSDKEPAGFIREIVPYVRRLTLCPIPGVSSFDPEALMRIALEAGIDEQSISRAESPDDALDEVITGVSVDGRVLITGSLYLVGYMRGLLREGFDAGASRG